ncbi:galactose oxidase [Aspergillus ellipticus CBS 707.79]|uniref:Galactose oxidase n=1 Tax=Aspergillus ellipticus CBS 707.79 TaxID=1448320 RepID=A0A319DYB7_9EURO|nr:galactose oxidase [Aspergillus ellipticus CBS 707.79]
MVYFPRSTGLAILSLLSLATAAAPPTCTPGEWVDLASIPQPRQEHGTTAIGNTTIAILGGIIPTGNSTSTTDLLQLYTIASDTWHTVSPAPYKVNHPNIAAVDNKLYLIGGLIEGPLLPGLTMNWIASGASHVYDIAADSWSELPSVPVGMERGSSVVGVHDEMIYLAGGMTVLQTGYQDAVDTVIAFNTTSGAWSRLVAEAAELPESRQHAAGSVIGDSFYVVGGRRYGQLNTKDTVFQLDLMDQEAGWKTSTGRMPVARGGINGGAVGSKFYVFGGEGNPDTNTGVFNQSEEFDTVSQGWAELRPMAVPRHGTQAAAVGGRVYVPGKGLQQDGKQVEVDGFVTFQNPSAHFDAYCA